METRRRKFQGVLNILSFNRHFYIIGLLVITVAGTLYLGWREADLIFWIAIAAFAYGLIMPLIVSAYVYDFSGYYQLHWLRSLPGHEKTYNTIVNINAGFDETSFLLNREYPGADLKVFDFYDKKRHTEPAIVRARKVSLVYPGTTQINTEDIPLGEATVDRLFLLSAAHEIRSERERVKFLQECYRVCAPGADVITVEHIRDFPNFLAFTIGFTHFFSSSTWKDSFKKAGFSSIEEIKFTPFMSIFRCKR